MPDAQNQIQKPRPVVLAILDGWGVAPHYNGNGITLANTPVYKQLITEYPTTTLKAFGEAVGLPWGEAGNSEVGHLNLGLGRILYQNLPRINKAINDKTFYKNPVLLKAINHVKNNNSQLHIMGLLSNGCVHSTIEHLRALLLLLKREKIKTAYIHAFLDGRDTPYNSGLNYIKDTEICMEEFGIGIIATVSGRFYAMDRNNNWDRTAKAYLAMTEGVGNQTASLMKAIGGSYKKKIYDEEFVPTVVCDGQNKPIGKINDNDVVIFFNFRPDRARQITKALVLPKFDKFKRPKFLKNLLFVGFTEYEAGLPIEVAFPAQASTASLGEVLAQANLKQLRIAETEKYAHVTYFFNGGQEEKFAGEDHVLIPSPIVSTYDLKPEMAAPEITKKLVELINSDKYDFILVNYANADMVGHTGNIPASVQAVETIDKCLGKLTQTVLDKNGLLMITADHGNIEDLFNMQTGQMDKEHSANPVPFILIGKEYQGRNVGWPDVAGGDLSLIKPQGILSDVAPTILKIFNLKKPKEMTGISLI